MSGIPTVEPAEDRAGAAPGPILSAKQRRPWLLGALVCAVASVSTFVPVYAMTGPSTNVASGPPAATPTVPSNPFADPSTGRTFTHVAEPCALLSPETVTRYSPNATCNPHVFQPQANTGSNAIWRSPPAQVLSQYFTISVEVILSPAARVVHNRMKTSATTMFTGLKVTDSRPITGLGDEAYVVYGTYSTGSRTYLLVLDGNAVIIIDYNGSIKQKPIPHEQAQAAVQAMARDVIAGLR
jgi:hypothetical protein